MTQDQISRLERLEKARQAERTFIDNPPPTVVVEFVESDGDGAFGRIVSELTVVVDPMPAILAKARRTKTAHRG